MRYLMRVIFWIYSKLPKKLCFFLPDEVEVKRLFYRYYRYFPNLKDPKTFDEKLQWYKLNFRVPQMSLMADKYNVRKYVKSAGFGNILNELYGVYDSVDQIDFNLFPDKFVLKATHGSAMNIICKNKQELDKGIAKREMGRWLKINYNDKGRQWVYKNIEKQE